MLLLYLTKIKHAFQKKRSLAELIKLFKKAIYSYNEEIILVKDLGDLTRFSLKNRLQVESIEKKYLPTLEVLSKQVGYGGRDPLRKLNEYLDNSCNGLIAKLNGEIIGCIWWGDNKMKSNFSSIISRFYVKEIKLTLSETYGFNFLIAPQYRGSGHAIEFLTKFLSVLRDFGYKRTFGFVASDNLPARWIYMLAGYKEIRKVKVHRILQFIVFRNKKIFFDKEALD